MVSAKGDGRLARGRRGEEVACGLLERCGYRIVDVNVRLRKKLGLAGELDIIAWDGPALCFVEVKTRRAVRGTLVTPAEAVTPAKQRQIARLSLAYAVRYGLGDGVPLRFDVVSVTLEADGQTACHTDLIRGAFLAPSDIEGRSRPRR